MSRARRTNLFFLGMLVFYLLMCFFVIPFVPSKWLDANGGIIFGQLLILIPALFYILSTKGDALEGVEFKRIGFVNVILLIVFTYCMLPVISLVNSISMMFSKNYVSERLDSMNSNPLLLNLFLVAVLPAFIEEITFRGVIYSGFKKSAIKYGILTSALMFGLFHMNVNQFCYAFLMGIVFALLREATGSMHSSMIVHFIFNANSVIMLKIVDAYTKYVNKMAETDERFEKIAEQMNESTNETVSYANYSISEKLGVIIPLLIFAIIGGILCFLIIRYIAKRCDRSLHLKQICYSFVGKRPKNSYYERVQYIETTSGEPGGKIVDYIFITSVVLCVLVMML